MGRSPDRRSLMEVEEKLEAQLGNISHSCPAPRPSTVFVLFLVSLFPEFDVFLPRDLLSS